MTSPMGPRAPQQADPSAITSEGIAQLAWAFLTTTVDVEGNEMPSRDYERAIGGCQKLAARMVGGVRGDDELHALLGFAFELEQLIRHELVAFAARVHESRRTGEALA